mmetsp:Transcript_62505/g.203930  ORF Transcript_62505/g.203930 Transcript_62505/m.203930 type:complete len:359 (-) Transcript_62505:2662-3738(-)
MCVNREVEAKNLAELALRRREGAGRQELPDRGERLLHESSHLPRGGLAIKQVGLGPILGVPGAADVSRADVRLLRIELAMVNDHHIRVAVRSGPPGAGAMQQCVGPQHPLPALVEVRGRDATLHDEGVAAARAELLQPALDSARACEHVDTIALHSQVVLHEPDVLLVVTAQLRSHEVVCQPCGRQDASESGGRQVCCQLRLVIESLGKLLREGAHQGQSGIRASRRKEVSCFARRPAKRRHDGVVSFIDAAPTIRFQHLHGLLMQLAKRIPPAPSLVSAAPIHLAKGLTARARKCQHDHRGHRLSPKSLRHPPRAGIDSSQHTLQLLNNRAAKLQATRKRCPCRPTLAGPPLAQHPV